MIKGCIYTLSLFVALTIAGTSALNAQSEGRYETPAPQSFGKAATTASAAADAVLTPRAACLLSYSSLSGNANQLMVYSSALQYFPSTGTDYVVLSTGFASQTAGVATTYVSHDMSGPTLPGNAPYASPDNQTSLDVLTFVLKFQLPSTSSATLSFDWQFGSEENPQYLVNYTDYFRADVFDGDGNHLGNIARLPNNNQVTTSTAAAFSNTPGGSSANPTPPFPNPNDVVYNAMTAKYTSSIDLSAYSGQEITVQFRVADVIDRILNSVAFIDNLDLLVVPDFSVTLSPTLLWPPNHTMRHIDATVDAGDDCFDWVLVSVTSNEPDNAIGNGDGNTINDIQGVDEDTPDTHFMLRAERAGSGTGRIYTATYKVFDLNGDAWYHTAEVVVPHSMVNKLAPTDGILPFAATLQQNYPNPFNPSTAINFSIPAEGNVRLTVYNSLGMAVATLVDGVLPAGSFMYSFDASALSGGTYFYMLEHNGTRLQRNMQLLK